MADILELEKVKTEQQFESKNTEKDTWILRLTPQKSVSAKVLPKVQ